MDIIFGLFAVIGTVVVYQVFSFFLRKSRVIHDHALVFDTIRKNTSYHWMFLEEVEDGLFRSSSPELQAAISRLFGSKAEDKITQASAVMCFIATLDSFGEVTVRQVLYTRRAVQDHPNMFQFLPDWKRQECEDYIIARTAYLARFVEKSADPECDASSIHHPNRDENIGMTLLQFRKATQGNKPDNHKEDPDRDFAHA